MRFFIIGRILDGEKVEAYKIYDANNKVTGIYYKNDVYKQVERGILVAGITRYRNGKAVELHYKAFNVKKVDELDGEGLPKSQDGRCVLVGVSGFSEKKKYRLVNSMGHEKIVTQDEFKGLVEKDLVVGAYMSKAVEGKINLYSHSNYKEYGY